LCPNSAANYGNLLHVRVTNFAKIDLGLPAGVLNTGGDQQAGEAGKTSSVTAALS
jgi:hypothetical protein